MSLNIKLWRRIVPHVVSNLEVSLFRYSLGRRTLLTISFDLSKHSKENHNYINSHWSNTTFSRRISTSKVRSGAEAVGNKDEGGYEGFQGSGQYTTGHACPICRDEYLVLHPENLDLPKQFISPINLHVNNREIVYYSKTGICQNQQQTDKKQSDEKLPEKPSLDKLQQVEKALIDSLSNIFVRPMDYKVYRSDLLFIDNIRGKRTTTLFQYVQQAALLRAAGHVKFAFVKFLVLNTDISKEEGRITIRWRIVGIGAMQVMLQFWKFKLWDWKGIMERQGTWHDGVSYFDVDSNGLIYRHIADKMMVDKDKDVIKPPKTVLVAGLLAALLSPGSSLLQCSSSSSKYSTKSSILP